MISASSLALDGPGVVGGGPYMTAYHRRQSHVATAGVAGGHQQQQSQQSPPLTPPPPSQDNRYGQTLPGGKISTGVAASAMGVSHHQYHHHHHPLMTSSEHHHLMALAAASGGAAGAHLYGSKPEFARPLPKARYNGAPSLLPATTTLMTTSNRPIVVPTPQHAPRKYEIPHSPPTTPGPVDLATPKDITTSTNSITNHHHQLLNQQRSTALCNYRTSRLPSTEMLPGLTYHNQQQLLYSGAHMFAASSLTSHQQYISSCKEDCTNNGDLIGVGHRTGFVPPRPVLVAESEASVNGRLSRMYSGQDLTGSKLPTTQQSRNSELVVGSGQQQQQQQAFKVPSGKEGSMKHRILRPSPPSSAAPLSPQSPSLVNVSSPALSATNLSSTNHVTSANAMQFSSASSSTTFASTSSTINSSVKDASPLHGNNSKPHNSVLFPASVNNNNNNQHQTSFVRGSLIRLASGELRRVEDMRTEDFVLSAQLSPDLRLADSTVVRISHHQNHHGQAEEKRDMATLTLSYNGHRDRVDFESTTEHPFFVYGQGWASCSPERTFRQYGLKCNRLRVGDVCISLTPRETATAAPQGPGLVANQSQARLQPGSQQQMPNHLQDNQSTGRHHTPHQDTKHSSGQQQYTKPTTDNLLQQEQLHGHQHHVNSKHQYSNSSSNSNTQQQTAAQQRQSLKQRVEGRTARLAPNTMTSAVAGPVADVLAAVSSSCKKRRWSAPDNVRGAAAVAAPDQDKTKRSRN